MTTDTQPGSKNWIQQIARRFRRSRLKVTGITLKRKGVWTEVWADIDGESVHVISEVYENEFHHSVTRSGLERCRYPTYPN